MGGASTKPASAAATATANRPEEKATEKKSGGSSKDQKTNESSGVVIEDVNKEPNFKAIHSAFRWNKPPEEIERLLTSEAAVNVPDPANGNRPIHIAAQNGHNELVKLLIRKKADLNIQNAKGNTGLHMAIGYDYYETAILLMENGSDTEMKNELDFPAKYGLEGNKALGIAALIVAKNSNDVLEGFQLCQAVVKDLDRAMFVQAGLKAKKTIGSAWTADMQETFKDLTSKCLSS
jgi:ankyrin repeat protein